MCNIDLWLLSNPLKKIFFVCLFVSAMKTTVKRHQIQLYQPSVAVPQETRRLSRAGPSLHITCPCPLQQQEPAGGLISSFSSMELQPHDIHPKHVVCLPHNSLSDHSKILWISMFIYAGLLPPTLHHNAAAATMAFIEHCFYK